MHGPSSTAPVPRRLLAALAALVVLSAGLGIHLGPHGTGERLQETTEAVASCDHPLAVHMEAFRVVHVRECPGCLLSHSNLSVVRPPSLALLASLPELLPPAPAHVAPRATSRSPSTRGPPSLSV